MSEITRELILSLFTVEMRTGQFFWKVAPRTHPRLEGLEAGSIRRGHSGKSYWHIKIGGYPYKRSHLMFLVVHGRFPHPCADHEDGNSVNDRPENVREATVLENAWNHKKRARRIKLPMGVRITTSGRFMARLGFKGKQLSLGSFDTPKEAHVVYLEKRKELYGQFA